MSNELCGIVCTQPTQPRQRNHRALLTDTTNRLGAPLGDGAQVIGTQVGANFYDIAPDH